MGNYLSFGGRIGRQTYWLHYVVPFTVINLIASAIDMNTMAEGGFGVLGPIVALVLLWPSLAGGVKRCHDRDHSGWFLLISLIPVVGAVWLLVELGFLRGTLGANRFGPDPLGGDAFAPSMGAAAR
ncbi:DUF805 domain-containing protein [Roseomonas sp. BN140053]|uniref:DUF805 domain-containing protein n=1 Tax=Roseomonas sp. BN140053 TaxID=3391898 RepID=UPI0039EBC540